jgi:hypothetical protein
VRWIKAWLGGIGPPGAQFRGTGGFKGTIEVDGKRAVTKGVFREGKKKGTIEVTELPIGVWTNKYKDQVEDWYEAKQISGRANYSTVDTVSFVLSPADLEASDKGLKLVSYVSMANMVAFDEGDHEVRGRSRHHGGVLRQTSRALRPGARRTPSPVSRRKSSGSGTRSGFWRRSWTAGS